MSSILLILFGMYFLVCVTQSSTSSVHQELGMINFYDPNYIKDPKVFTGRTGRRDSYKSNFTLTILQSWANNVTVTVLYANKQIGNFQLLKVGCCDAFKQFWLEQFIYQYIFKGKDEKLCPFPVVSDEWGKSKWQAGYPIQYLRPQDRQLRYTPDYTDTYWITNLELPPKHFPIPLPKGNAQLTFVAELTETRTVIFKCSLKIKIY